MKSFGRFLVKIASYLLEHPELIQAVGELKKGNK